MRSWIPATAVSAAVAASLAGAVVGGLYSRTADVGLTQPTGVMSSSDTAAACTALHAALPDTVNGGKRRGTTPQSVDRAAWGNPAVTLRCGVARPGIITPGAGNYDPLGADLPWINGVAWVAELKPGGVLFTTTNRALYVEVWSPVAGGDMTSAPDPLVDLAGSILKTIPRKDGVLAADTPDQ
jgi:hypothetical protein